MGLCLHRAQCEFLVVSRPDAVSRARRSLHFDILGDLRLFSGCFYPRQRPRAAAPPAMRLRSKLSAFRRDGPVHLHPLFVQNCRESWYITIDSTSNIWRVRAPLVKELCGVQLAVRDILSIERGYYIRSEMCHPNCRIPEPFLVRPTGNRPLPLGQHSF